MLILFLKIVFNRRFLCLKAKYLSVIPHLVAFFSPLILIFVLNIYSFSAETLNVTDAKEGETYPAGTVFFNNTGEVVYFRDWFASGTRSVEFRGDAATGGYWSTRVLNPSFTPGFASTITSNPYYVEPLPPTEDSKPVIIHVHEWIEGEIYSATQTTEGLGGIYCKTCGEIKESWPISAYGYSINDYATPMVNASKAGQTVTFELGEWNSFPKAFMEKIAAKSAEGVTFVFHYKWNHVKQEITISAGAQVDLNYEWYGPAKMAELYGAN